MDLKSEVRYTKKMIVFILIGSVLGAAWLINHDKEREKNEMEEQGRKINQSLPRPHVPAPEIADSRPPSRPGAFQKPIEGLEIFELRKGWYNIAREDMGTWKAAPAEDRLGTALDIMAAWGKGIDNLGAENLVECISKGGSKNENMLVGEMAGLCKVMVGL